MQKKTIYKTILFFTLVTLQFTSIFSITSCASKQHQETIGQYVDGGIITSQVKSKILSDKMLNNTSITVKTYKNTVQLSGYVDTLAQKKHAENLALSVKEVENVDNALAIKVR